MSESQSGAEAPDYSGEVLAEKGRNLRLALRGTVAEPRLQVPVLGFLVEAEVGGAFGR